jgi:hypothetical protein
LMRLKFQARPPDTIGCFLNGTWFLTLNVTRFSPTDATFLQSRNLTRDEFVAIEPLMCQMRRDRLRLARSLPRSDRCGNLSSRLETFLDPEQIYQFTGLFIACEAQVPVWTIRRDWPSRRIENVMEHPCCLSLSASDSLKPKVPPMNDLARAKRPHDCYRRAMIVGG